MPTPEMNGYSCPEETLGSYYSGPTRVSLLDSVTNRIINTVTVRTPFGDKDEFDVPYLIHANFYRVEPPLKDGEGKPVILDLKDYNGDGKALEFAFFAAVGQSVLANPRSSGRLELHGARAFLLYPYICIPLRRRSRALSWQRDVAAV